FARLFGQEGRKARAARSRAPGIHRRRRVLCAADRLSVGSADDRHPGLPRKPPVRLAIPPWLRPSRCRGERPGPEHRAARRTPRNGRRCLDALEQQWRGPAVRTGRRTPDRPLTVEPNVPRAQKVLTGGGPDGASSRESPGEVVDTLLLKFDDRRKQQGFVFGGKG